MKILLILGPFVGLFPDLAARKLKEISIKMDDEWKLFGLTSYLTDKITLPCPFELHKVHLLGSPRSALTRIIYLLCCIIKGTKLVKEEKIPVITQHDGHLEYGIVAYAIARLTHRKCLIRVNEDTLIPLLFFLKASGSHLFRSETVLKIVAFTYREIEHIFFKHVDWILTHGPMDYQKIRKTTSKISFVPLWVDTEKFRPFSPESRRTLREKIVSRKDVKIILFVGRLHPEKGVKTLLQALKILEDKETLLLMIYSISEYKNEYELMARELGLTDKVRFMGYVSHDDLPRYYNISDFCVLPSIREEWSNTIMEAMACKTPIVATEVGGNPYLVTEGETGFLFRPKDPCGLASKLTFLFENQDLVKQVTETAAEEIKKYDKTIVGDLYKSVVKNLFQNKT